MIRNILLFSGALLVSACVTDTGGEEPGPIDELAQCVANGGTVERRGMLNSEMCVMPYSDAGKVCTDASQCEGSCLADPSSSNAQSGQGNAKGLCQADDKLFGCVAFIENGAVQRTLCID